MNEYEKDVESTKSGGGSVSMNKIMIILIQFLAVLIVGAFDLASVGFSLSRLGEMSFYANLISTFIASSLIFLATGYGKKQDKLEEVSEEPQAPCNVYKAAQVELDSKFLTIGTDFDEFADEYTIAKKRKLLFGKYETKRIKAEYKSNKSWLFKWFWKIQLAKFTHLVDPLVMTDDYLRVKKVNTVKISETSVFNEVDGGKSNDPDAALKNDLWQTLEDLLPKALIAATVTAVFGTLFMDFGSMDGEAITKLMGKVDRKSVV